MRPRLREWILRVWGTIAKPNNEVEEELRFHLEMAEEEALRRGASVRHARLRAGGLAQAADEARDQRAIRGLTDFLRDIRLSLLLDTSPGTEQQIGLIRPRDLKEGDRAGVIGYTRSLQMLQSLTEDREALAKALQRAGMRITVGVYFGRSPAAGRGSLPGSKPFMATQSISREHCAKYFANLVIGVLKCESAWLLCWMPTRTLRWAKI